ncbi:formylglycine-generating enzyme family protein [Lacipirellula parvula]|uniref:Sulfatase-modifying factor enzyme-like domain-containing protein n=1 Tax=Lacipirellula parvula TaxID=2650471 RepID=A0A5K7XGI4_9BACT|nr:SUMF1/EgtB/PvdO family nonheme iron enzyme [Lacipirellula parvula]BBO32079.1 hypothetical protein PLANPX_1691 [Lacipirellula parvula]
MHVASADIVFAVTIDWATVGDTGNYGGPESYGRTFGAVNYAYQIGKYEVTNAQYAEFLNIKDPSGTNPYGLYNAKMGTDANGGILFDATANQGSKYSLKQGSGQQPVNFVSWFDSVRFTNWLNNGQGDADTETGAYTLQGGTTVPTGAKAIIRNSGATIVLPTEDEWYKAAYYDPEKTGGAGYWTYPTRSDSVPTSTFPGPTPNAANLIGNGFAMTPGAGTRPLDIVPGINYLTNVGAYTASSNYYGTFDQAGNVYEWNEALLMPEAATTAGVRGVMGGSFYNPGEYGTNLGWFASTATVENVGQGFRVVNLATPAAPGDFNGDGSVDNADLTDPIRGWEARFGVDLDGGDFLDWQRNYSGPSPEATTAGVPEPNASAIVLTIATLAGTLRVRTRRTSSGHHCVTNTTK